MRPVDADEAKRIAREYLTDPYHVISAVAVLDKTPTLTPPNEPLSLEQLREMDGVTALWVHFRAWNAHKPRLMLVRKAMNGWWSCCDHNGFLTFNEKDYGNMFLLYRRPPEGEEDT